MLHARKQQYECDSCRELITRSAVVVFYEDKHFCCIECCHKWQDAREEDLAWKEKVNNIASAGYD